jgi:transcriptional regulator with XRE-family HTH domain
MASKKTVRRDVSKGSLRSAFAANLRSERARRKLSQEALAAKAGLSVSYISMLEREQRTPPLETVEQVAQALDLAPAQRMFEAT